jgi:hypothetical protein
MRTYGLVNPTLTATYAGFVAGEDFTVLTSPADLSTAANANSPAGIYPINTSGAAAVNYSISYVAGTLTVVAPTELGGVSVNGSAINFAFPTVPGQKYQVEFRDNLSSPWVPLGEPIIGTGNPTTITNAITGPQGFFRLNIMP